MSADHGTGVAGDSERYNGGVPLSERPSACANAVGPGNHDTMVRTANRVSGVAGINVSGPVEQAGQSASLPAMGSFRRNLMAAMIIFSNLMQVGWQEKPSARVNDAELCCR